MEGRLTNRVLIIGAQGVLGALTVGAFRDAGWAVRSAARRPAQGQIGIDLDRPDSVEATLQEDELVINTVPHPDLLAERHVLEHGGALINVSALPAAAGRSLRAVAGAARGTVVMNAGLAPGVTTIVAADLLRLHPDAGELEIVYTFLYDSPWAGKRRLHPPRPHDSCSSPDGGRPAAETVWRARLPRLRGGRRGVARWHRRRPDRSPIHLRRRVGDPRATARAQRCWRYEQAPGVSGWPARAVRRRHRQRRTHRALDRRDPRGAAAWRPHGPVLRRLPARRTKHGGVCQRAADPTATERLL